MQQRYLLLARMTARAMQRREQAAGAHMPRIMTEQDSESCSCSQQCSRWMNAQNNTCGYLRRGQAAGAHMRMASPKSIIFGSVSPFRNAEDTFLHSARENCTAAICCCRALAQVYFAIQLVWLSFS